MPPGWFSNGDLSGGAILDLHIHDTDFVYYLFGMPTAVRSAGYSKTSGKTDHIVTQYLYDDGPNFVSAEGSWCMADGFAFTMRYCVNFENATADFDISRENPLIIYDNGKAENITLEGDGYQAELEYMIQCINDPQDPMTVTADDAVASLRIIEAEQRSIDTGAPVKL
jgi:predicted dehydrogenase